MVPRFGINPSVITPHDEGNSTVAWGGEHTQTGLAPIAGYAHLPDHIDAPLGVEPDPPQSLIVSGLNTTVYGRCVGSGRPQDIRF